MVIKIFEKYSSLAPDARYKSIHGERPKILSPKQLLQRSLIALIQVNKFC